MEYAATGNNKPDRQHAVAILSDLLDNVELEACDWRPEVLDACLRRAPLRFGATGFGFDGQGVSYHTAKGAEPLVGYRNDDRVTVRHGSGEEPETLNFSHTDGAPRAPDESFEVVLEPGDWVAYRFRTDHTRRVTITLDAAEGTAAAHVDGAPLAPMADSPHRFLSQSIPPGGHVLRVDAVHGAVRLRAAAVHIVDQ